MDPFSAGAKVIVGLWQTHKANEWIKLVFSMAWSYFVAFNFACGSALVAHTAPALAVGAGMISGVSVMVFLWSRSPLTKGMKAAVPVDALLDSEASKGIVTIEGGK